MAKEFRIGISGPDCSGKHDLASMLSKELGLPHISTKGSQIFKGIIHPDSFNHSQILKRSMEDPKGMVGFQESLLELRNEIASSVPVFVAERTPLDSIVYYLASLASQTTTQETHEFITACKVSFKIYTHVIVILPFNGSEENLDAYVKKLHGPGTHIKNQFYQKMLNCLFNEYGVGNEFGHQFISVTDINPEKNRTMLLRELLDLNDNHD